MDIIVYNKTYNLVKTDLVKIRCLIVQSHALLTLPIVQTVLILFGVNVH